MNKVKAQKDGKRRVQLTQQPFEGKSICFFGRYGVLSWTTCQCLLRSNGPQKFIIMTVAHHLLGNGTFDFSIAGFTSLIIIL